MSFRGKKISINKVKKTLRDGQGFDTPSWTDLKTNGRDGGREALDHRTVAITAGVLDL